MTEDKIFENCDFTTPMPDDSYSCCRFVNCNFGEAVVTTNFNECRFEQCNFTLTKLSGKVRNTLFSGCKMVGAILSELNRFSGNLTLEDCNLDYSVWTGLRLRKTIFRNCRLTNASLMAADFTSTVFDNCNLDGTEFLDAVLEKADFSTSYNFIINPQTCRLKKAVFSESELRGLVSHLNIIIK